MGLCVLPLQWLWESYVAMSAMIVLVSDCHNDGCEVIKTGGNMTQKLSMKSARDRPSSNLGFNLQVSESNKPPRDRSQQALGST